ncbi:MAG: GNAT family N-acetyltransferase, partial [Chlamydiae bacterium]|nr:GNAT family N-acetyltransferase [Chlamydiota bacterium]
MENHDLRISSSSNKSLPNIKIVTWSELDIRAQEAAFRAIASINMQTSTEEGTTWEKYTVLIQDRLQNCKGAKDTFFIAQVPDTGQFIGYCAFYTVKDLLPYPSRFLLGDENRAYCSWTAVDPKFRGQGIAEKLKQQLFCPDHAFTSF